MRTPLSNYLLSRRRRPFYVRGFFALLLLVGLFCYRDYGVSWDEATLRQNGMVNAKYIASQLAPAWTAREPKFANVADIHGNFDNHHGVLFELPVVVLAKCLGVADSRAYYLLRHLAVFCCFVGGVWALYRLARTRLGSWQWGLLLSALLVLSPRFFAEAFYNGTDIVFMALFAVGVYTLVRLVRRPTLRRALLHGLVTAAAVDVRILGTLLVALTLGMAVLEIAFGQPGRQGRWALARALALYLAVAAAGTVAGWPYLWEAPVPHFLYAFRSLSHYPWTGQMLYLGRSISAQQLPWHYAPVWIFITTPLAYTGAFLVGVAFVLTRLLRHPIAYLRTRAGRLDALLLAWVGLPILLIIGLHSVLYDGWRHLYFVYPALLLLAGRGAQALWQARWRSPIMRWLAVAAAALAGLETTFTLVQMVQAHPQQQMYFSCLPPAVAERLFEGDYWGLSYRQGLEWIARHDRAPTLSIAGQNVGLIENNLAILNRSDRVRFRPVAKMAQARYFLSAYRNHPAPYPDSVGCEVYRVEAYGRRVLSVFRRPGTH